MLTLKQLLWYSEIIKLNCTYKLSFTSLSKVGGDSLGKDATVSAINLPMLISTATCPSWEWKQMLYKVVVENKIKKIEQNYVPQHHQHVCRHHLSKPIVFPLWLPFLPNHFAVCQPLLSWGINKMVNNVRKKQRIVLLKSAMK